MWGEEGREVDEGCSVGGEHGVRSMFVHQRLFVVVVVVVVVVVRLEC